MQLLVLLQASAGRHDDAVRLLRAAEGVLLRADLPAMEREISRELGDTDGDEADAPIDLAAEQGAEGAEAGAAQEFRWQVRARPPGPAPLSVRVCDVSEAVAS